MVPGQRHAQVHFEPVDQMLLPAVLQVPFARYIARRGVSYLKRYSIDNVYRESRLVGLHPRELAACSFDIVTSGQSVVADAEVVAIVSEIVLEVPSLGARNCRLRLNHTALVKAMLLHCGVAEALHADIYAILGDSKVCNSFFIQRFGNHVVCFGQFWDTSDHIIHSVDPLFLAR